MNSREISKKYSYSHTPDVPLLALSGLKQPANQVILSWDKFSNGRQILGVSRTDWGQSFLFKPFFDERFQVPHPAFDVA
jgi:hypothetical protein